MSGLSQWNLPERADRAVERRDTDIKKAAMKADQRYYQTDSSCVDPASDIQICSIVNYYFRISFAGSPAMDLLDVADSYHKCSQYLFC